MTFFRLLTTTAAFAMATTMANAADMPVKAPAPLPVVQQQASGYVEVYGGWASTRIGASECFAGGACFDDSLRVNGWALGGAGRGNYWLAPNMSMQLDAQAEGVSHRIPNGPGGTNFNSSSHSYLIGGHFNWRDSQRGLFGVFAAAGDQSAFFSESKRHVIAGGEAQIYWNQFTLYIQGGYDTTVGTYFEEMHAWFIRGTGRYFFTPNTMLEGTVLYANGDVDFRGPFAGPVDAVGFHTWLWEAKLEHRFATTPFALFVKYRGSEMKSDTLVAAPGFSSQTKVTDNRVLVGLRLFMGQNTLLSNDRQGATLDIKEIGPVFAPQPNLPPG